MNAHRRRWARKKERILKKDAGKCHYCGVALTPKTMTVDHVVPKSKGGTTAYTNVVAACLKCNGSKRDLDVVDFVSVLKPTAVEA